MTSTEDGVADTWSFHDRGKLVTVKVTGNLQCNDGEVLTRWALAGEGLALLPFEYELCSQQRDHELLGRWDYPGAAWFTYGSGKSFVASKPFPAEFLY